MAGGSVAEFLLKQAWGALWKQGTPYSLPNVLVNGASGDGKTVPPLGDRPVPDLGPFGLFGDSTFGEINLGLSGASIGGLQTAGDGGFSYVDATQVFTAKINFSGLTFNGNYAVTGNGLLGCAVAGASGLMHILPGLKADAAGDETRALGEANDDEDARLQQARDYRDRLVQSPAGLELVGTYYDNNWAMNEVVRGDNKFTRFMDKERAKSSAMATQTSDAAAAPDDPDKTVGDENYYYESMRRQLAFINACYAISTHDEDPYADAAAATNSFSGVVDVNYDGPVTVGHVMTQVADAPAGELSKQIALRSSPHPFAAEQREFKNPAMRAAYARAVADIEAFTAEDDASGAPDRTFSELTLMGDMSIGSGGFEDTFAAPDVTITGTVTITGGASDPTLTVTITKLAANLPSIDITLLHTTKWPQDSLYDKVAQSLANAGFVHDLIRSKLGEKLGDAEVLSYLSARINDALAKALGAF